MKKFFKQFVKRFKKDKKFRIITLSGAGALLLAIIILICALAIGGRKGKVDDYVLNMSQIQLNKNTNYSLAIVDNTSDKKEFQSTWMSENPSIATVTEMGVVTGISAGNTNITAKLSFGGNSKEVTLTCSIEVIEENIPLTNVMFMKESFEVYESTATSFDQNLIFYPGNASNKKMTWTSADEEIISFSGTSAVAIANKIGTTTISAVSEDGGFEISCEVTVIALADAIESLKLNKSTINMTENSKTTLSATIEPSSSKASVIWTSSNASVATVKNGTVTAVSTGEAIITATIADVTSTKTATCIVRVYAETPSFGSTYTPSNPSNPSTKSPAVSFPKAYLYAKAGDSQVYTLAPKINFISSGTGVWKSSNPSIVSINSSTGEMKVCNYVSEEKIVTITYTIDGVSGEFFFVVLPTSSTITYVSFDKNSVHIAVGEEMQLTAKIKPEGSGDTITYTSSDENIVKVDSNGKIIGVANGKAKITAKASSSGHTDTCEVVVGKLTVKASLVFPEQNSSMQLTKDGKTTLKVVFDHEFTAEELATLDIKVTNEDPSIVVCSQNNTVTTYDIHALNFGTTTIDLTITGNSEKYEFICLGAMIEVIDNGTAEQ